MFDFNTSSSFLDSFQLIVAIYLFYIAIRGQGSMYRFFDLPEKSQKRVQKPLRIIYFVCALLALLDTTLSALQSSMFTVTFSGDVSTVVQNYELSAFSFLSYDLLNAAGYILTGAIVLLLCSVLLWLWHLRKS